MDINSAIQELTNLWKKQGGNKHIFQKGNTLWHSGLLDLQSNDFQKETVTWITPDSSQQDHYNNWAKDDGNRENKAAYKNILSNNNEFIFAKFGKEHFSEITINHLEGSHSALNKALFNFCYSNNIDGIIRGAEDNEIALRSDKLKTLNLIKQIKLP